MSEYSEVPILAQKRMLPPEKPMVATASTERKPSAPEVPVLPKAFLDTMIKQRMSNNTKRTYSHHLKLFLQFLQKPPEEATDADISNYILHLAENDFRAASYQKAAINAIKFHYEKVLHRTIDKSAATWPKVEHKLPVVFSMEEVVLLLKNVENIKHRCILYLIYSGGFRRTEVVHLKVSDLDFDRKQIRVRQAKGKKDRYTILSDKAAELLKQYMNYHQPSKWLFPGQNGGQYSTNSIQQFFKKALGKTTIQKEVTLHSLRHSGHPSARTRGEPPYYSGITWPQQPENDSDLYSCDTNVTEKHKKPARWIGYLMKFIDIKLFRRYQEGLLTDIRFFGVF